MELYHAFKEQIDSQGDKKLKAQLLEIMLTVVQDKPSLAMNEYDRSPLAKIWPFQGKANDNIDATKSMVKAITETAKDIKETIA